MAMIWLAGIVLCTIGWITGVHAAESPALPPAVMAPPPQPTKLPEFNFANLQGGTLSSAEMKGKVILIHFWATW